MIPVDNSFNYYEGFEGCGLKCQDPLYSEEQHEYISNVIFYGSVTSFLATGLVIVSHSYILHVLPHKVPTTQSFSVPF
jgi:smoothened protein